MASNHTAEGVRRGQRRVVVDLAARRQVADLMARIEHEALLCDLRLAASYIAIASTVDEREPAVGRAIDAAIATLERARREIA